MFDEIQSQLTAWADSKECRNDDVPQRVSLTEDKANYSQELIVHFGKSDAKLTLTITTSDFDVRVISQAVISLVRAATDAMNRGEGVTPDIY